jgi:integrase
MIGLVAPTGLRIGELLGLRWRALDLANGTLRVLESVFESEDTGRELLRKVDRGEWKSTRRADAPGHSAQPTLERMWDRCNAMLMNAPDRPVIWSHVGLDHHRHERVAAPGAAASEAAAPEV